MVYPKLDWLAGYFFNFDYSQCVFESRSRSTNLFSSHTCHVHVYLPSTTFKMLYSPWAQRGHRAPPPPPGSSRSGIILFRGPHWSIIEMLTPYKLGRHHLFGHFSKWPPSKSSENWIAHILAFGQPRNTNLVSKPTFSRSLNPIGML